jgi:hypothetical protein
MSEKRYTVNTVAKYLSLSTSAVYTRMRLLKINSVHGLSVHDVKTIMEYKCRPRYGTTVADLAKEMEETYCERRATK